MMVIDEKNLRHFSSYPVSGHLCKFMLGAGVAKKDSVYWQQSKSQLPKAHSFIWKIFVIIPWANSTMGNFLKMYFIWFKKLYGRNFALEEFTALWCIRAGEELVCKLKNQAVWP